MHTKAKKNEYKHQSEQQKKTKKGKKIEKPSRRILHKETKKIKLQNIK